MATEEVEAAAAAAAADSGSEAAWGVVAACVGAAEAAHPVDWEVGMVVAKEVDTQVVLLAGTGDCR